MLARKSVKQRFKPDRRVIHLLAAFRHMTNDCIRIGLTEGRTSLKSLSLTCYPKLKTYEVPSAYKLCAISKAAGILMNYRKLSRKRHVKEPYCMRSSLTTCYGLKILTGRLRMAGGVEIPLNHHVQRFLSQPRIEVRSVTLTTECLSISVRRQIVPINCEGMLGIDRNLNNVTLADTENQVERYDLSTATAIKSWSRRTKARFTRTDARVKGRIFRKYGRIERDRVNWLLHNASAKIVLRAKLKREAIAMEDLRGIRKLYQKGNGQGTHFRSRMNSWSFAELERQIKYKADWNGIPVIYVRPHGTSAKCSMCGHRVLPEEDRQLHCPKCGLVVDRDVNAARNILARGLRFKPVGPASEAMVQEPSTRELLLKVDAGQSTSKFIR